MGIFDALKNIFAKDSSSPANPERNAEKTEQIFCVQSASSGNVYTVDPSDITCSCPDWVGNRSQYAKNNLSRMCKHLASFYACNAHMIPDALKNYSGFISYFHEQGRGLPHSPNIIYSGPVGGELVVITKNDQSEEWINIYEDNESYGLNIIECRWAYGKWPKQWKEIVPLSYNLTTPSLFDNIDVFEIIAKSCDEAYEQEKLQNSSPEVSWENTIVPMLKDAFDGDVPDYFQHEKRKNYFIIYKDNIRDWIFRVHYGANGIKYVEMKNGSEFRVTYDNLLYANSKKKFARAVH